jgi:hypothetical protein
VQLALTLPHWQLVLVLPGVGASNLESARAMVVASRPMENYKAQTDSEKRTLKGV